MEELKKLVQIIHKKGVSKASLLNFNKKTPNKELQLFDGLASGKINNEEDAIKYIYNGDETLQGFKMVKSRLRKKLLNQLFFLEFQDTSNTTSHTAEHECFSKLHQARVLMNAGAYDLASPLLQEVLSLAQLHSLYDVLFFTQRSLLQVYSNLGERSAFAKMLRQVKEFSPSLSADLQVEQIFLESKVEIGHSISARKEFLSKVDTTLEDMGRLWREAKSFSAFNYFYILSNIAQELKGNFEQIIELTANSERLLEENNINTDRFDTRYNKFIQVYAYLRAKRLQEGLELASLYESSFNPTSNNWFAFMENYFLLAMHSKNYLVAHGVLHKILVNPFLKKINKMAQERWRLFEAYLHFVSPRPELSYKYQSLLQNVPSYSKDKEGYNVAILILQVMYYLKNGEIESLVYRMEALKKYASKHFKDSFSERSYTFFKLLGILVQKVFDPITIQRRGQYLFQKLQRLTPPGDAYAEIEIIPYEHLWELILTGLKEKSFKTAVY